MSTLADQVDRMTPAELRDLVGELEERLETAEATIADWAPFVNQMRMTMAQLALHPMVRAMVPPQFQHTLAQYAPPKE